MKFFRTQDTLTNHKIWRLWVEKSRVNRGVDLLVRLPIRWLLKSGVLFIINWAVLQSILIFNSNCFDPRLPLLVILLLSLVGPSHVLKTCCEVVVFLLPHSVIIGIWVEVIGRGEFVWTLCHWFKRILLHRFYWRFLVVNSWFLLKQRGIGRHLLLLELWRVRVIGRHWNKTI